MSDEENNNHLTLAGILKKSTTLKSNKRGRSSRKNKNSDQEADEKFSDKDDSYDMGDFKLKGKETNEKEELLTRYENKKLKQEPNSDDSESDQNYTKNKETYGKFKDSDENDTELDEEEFSGNESDKKKSKHFYRLSSNDHYLNNKKSIKCNKINLNSSSNSYSTRSHYLRSNRDLDNKENDDDFEIKKQNNACSSSLTSNNNTSTASDQEYQIINRVKINPDNHSKLKFSNIYKKSCKESNSMSSKQAKTRLSKRTRTNTAITYREDSSSSNISEETDEDVSNQSHLLNKKKINGNHSRKKRRCT